MRRWSFQINSYHKTSNITLETLPVYVYLIELINDKVCGFISRYLAVPFPDILPKKRLTKEDCGCKTENGCDFCNRKLSLKDWYGDFGQFWHGYVCITIFDLCYKYKNKKEYNLEIDYDKCKELFYEDNKLFFDEQEKFAERMRKENEN